MLNFENTEEFVSYMFENIDNEDNSVSVIANKKISIDIMKELLNYENVILNSCEIDYDEEYDREYAVSLFNDIESDYWYVSVEKSYLFEKKKYASTGGYVLFHEDVNSKALIDMQNNDCTPLVAYDWFVIDEDNKSGNDDVTDEDTDIDSEMHGFSVHNSDKHHSYSYSFYSTNKDLVNKEINYLRKLLNVCM